MAQFLIPAEKQSPFIVSLAKVISNDYVLELLEQGFKEGWGPEGTSLVRTYEGTYGSTTVYINEENLLIMWTNAEKESPAEVHPVINADNFLHHWNQMWKYIYPDKAQKA